MKKKLINSLYFNILFFMVLAFMLTIGTNIAANIFSGIINSDKNPFYREGLIAKDFNDMYDEFILELQSFDSQSKVGDYIENIPARNNAPFAANNMYYVLLDENSDFIVANNPVAIIEQSDILSELNIGFIVDSQPRTPSENVSIEAVTFSQNQMQEISYPQFLEYRFKKIAQLENGNYILVYYIKTFMPLLFVLGLAMFICFFILLFRGRLVYLSKIQKAINDVSDVDTFEPLPMKYKNELTSIAAEVNSVAKLLKENKDAEREFLLNISHDLRTPLNSIIGFAEIIQRDKNLSQADKKKYIGYVLKKGKYLEMLLNQFFEFARIKWDNRKPKEQKIEIQQLLSQIFEGYLPELKKNSLEFEFDFEATPINFYADVPMLLRALHNIVSNAIKYSKAKTTIKASAKTTNNKVIIEVWNVSKDDIDSIETERLFEKFFKNDAARTDEGSGLGLAIAKEIVNRHYGDISATTKGDMLGIIIELPNNY